MENLHCLTCKYEPDWEYQSNTIMYNHKVTVGWCKFSDDYDVPPCYSKFAVCIIDPDNPAEEIRFGIHKQGSIQYMHSCGGWRPSDKYLEMPNLDLTGEDDAQISL